MGDAQDNYSVTHTNPISPALENDEAPEGFSVESQILSNATSPTSKKLPASAAPPSSPNADMPKSVGRYEIRRILGKGGFGLVR